MELRDLEGLVAIADERHITRAAASLHLAQPALSRQLRRLEAELGLQLVERTTKRVALTAAGEVLVARARRVLNEVDAARSELEDLRGLRAGKVVLGVSRATRSFPLAELLADFRRTAPEIELVVREDLSAPITQAIRDAEVDLGLITPLADDRAIEGLEVRVVSSERLVAVLPPGHPLAGRRRLRLADLHGEPLVAFPPEAVIRRRVERHAAALGLDLRPTFVVTEVARLRSFVAAGLGVSVLPASDAAAPGDPVATVPLTGEGLHHRVCIARREGREHGPAVRAFLVALERHAGLAR